MKAKGKTDPRRQALRFLASRGGDGIFDRNGVLTVAGERAPFMRSTWNKLRDCGHVEFYNPSGKGRGRCRVTPDGHDAAMKLGSAFDVPACIEQWETADA